MTFRPHPNIHADPARHVVIVGLMGTGKTSIGTALAALLGRSFSDSDGEILAATGRTAREIADDGGADAIHDEEEKHLLAALRRSTPLVIGAAASVIDVKRCRDAMIESAVVVWLRADLDTLVERFATGDHRPLYGTDVATMFAAQLESRNPGYEAAADVIVDVGSFSQTPLPTTIAEQIRSVLGWERAGTTPRA